MGKKVLVIGGGGREHALVEAINNSDKVDKIYCAPGNPGIAELAECVPIKADDIYGLLAFAHEKEIDLTVVGPEAPLVKGIVNEFEVSGLRIVGPTKEAAELEGSKAFSKGLCHDYGIPTANYSIFNSTDAVRNYLQEFAETIYPTVIKVSGLAAGKGVCVCHNDETASEFLFAIDSGKFGHSSDWIVVEDFLPGEEASYIVLVDKNGNFMPLASAQDHKPVFDGDLGPNTGGMGAYSPAPVMTPEVVEKTNQRIVIPVIKAMKERGTPYSGPIYFGLMINKSGDPFLVEINCRMGDPETQPILALLNCGLLPYLEAMIDGTLDTMPPLLWRDEVAVTVVMAAEGYPGEPKKGDPITGIAEAEDLPGITVHHAGTAWKDGQLVTNGGRVLSVTALGANIEEAIENAYEAVGMIDYAGKHYRTDIAKKAIGR